MKTKQIELYEFDELPEGVKKNVLEKNRHINTDYEWYDFLFDDWKEKLEAIGFENPNISFIGFYSQGDGASFTCKNVDVVRFLTSQKKKGEFKNILKAIKGNTHEINVAIERINHHYGHEYTVTVNTEIVYYGDGEPEKYAALETEEGGLQELVIETARSLMRKIYRELEKEYEYLTSDEAVIDTIKANKYTFRANGKMENL
jgi:hypothetical protein